MPKRKATRKPPRTHTRKGAAAKAIPPSPDLARRGRLAQQQTADELRIMHRRRRAYELKEAGAAYTEIARQCGVSVFTAHQDVQTVLYEHKEADQALIEFHRELELKRLEKQRMRLAIKLAKGEYKAHEVALRISERKAKLLGLDQKGPEGLMPVEQVVQLMRGVTALFLDLVADVDLRRQFVSRLRRQAGLIGQPLDLPRLSSTPQPDVPADATVNSFTAQDQDA